MQERKKVHHFPVFSCVQQNIREHLLDNRPPLYMDSRDVDNNRYDDDDDVIGDEFDMNSGDGNCLCEAELSQNRYRVFTWSFTCVPVCLFTCLFTCLVCVFT